MDDSLIRTSTATGEVRQSMRRWFARSARCACLALAAWGCGDSDSDPAPSGGGGSSAEPTAGSGRSSTEPTADRAGAPAEPTTVGEGGSPTDPATLDWQPLLTGDWTIPAGTETYVCVRHTVTEDVFARAFDAINPLGTHHTFLTVGPPSGPDGVTPCFVAENHGEAIFGSGVGTSPIEFPEGVAVKLTAGTQLLLNLHLFNTSDDELSGTSGTRFVSMKESEVEHLSKSLTVGSMSLNIPPMQESSSGGSCTMAADATVFAVLPHMHQLGSHFKITAQSSIDGERVLHDAPFDFDSQVYYPFEPVRLAVGDKLQFECTWENTTERTVTWGDSSVDEMCTAGLYRYPAEGSDFCFR
jgi:hypothetical protein